MIHAIQRQPLAADLYVGVKVAACPLTMCVPDLHQTQHYIETRVTSLLPPLITAIAYDFVRP